MTFAQKLQTLRKQWGLSQEQLAEKTGVSRQAITKWESGNGLPDIENLMTLASLFSVSLDDLLSEEKLTRSLPDYSYESVTEYDVNRLTHFDIHSCGAAQITVAAADSEKLKVRLASNVIQSPDKEYKVKMDEHRNRIDVNIRRIGEVSELQTKEALFIEITLPKKYCDDIELHATTDALLLAGLQTSFELDGRVSRVILEGVTGKAALNSSADMDISCDGLPEKLEVNQISAACVLRVPKGSRFYTKTKGRSNQIRLAGVEEDPDAECCVELAGMNAELSIEGFTETAE